MSLVGEMKKLFGLSVCQLGLDVNFDLKPDQMAVRSMAQQTDSVAFAVSCNLKINIEIFNK